MKLTNVQDWASLINLKLPFNATFNGVCVDSRLQKPGKLFFALAGANTDGHLHLSDAKERGAEVAIVSKEYQGPNFGLHLIPVDSPLQSLQLSAKELVRRRKSRVVGITGSVAKTTTKEFTAALLKSTFTVGNSPGNSNSQIGLPLTIFNDCNGDEEILVLEMGMTHPGHITQLVDIARPEVTLITEIALVHACSFNSREHIAQTKAEIFSHPDTRLGIFPYEIPNRKTVENIGNCRKMTFSRHTREADYYLDEHNLMIVEKKSGTSIKIPALHLPGRHNLYNLLAAISIARYFNVDWQAILATIPTLQLPEKRLQSVHKNQIHFINDSYNAAEISVKAALDYLSELPKQGKKIAVLGSMMELGSFSDDCHRNVGKYALDKVDHVYCYGVECEPIKEVWQKAGRPIELFLDFNLLVSTLRRDLQPNDQVLLKGSRSKQLWKVLEEI